MAEEESNFTKIRRQLEKDYFGMVWLIRAYNQIRHPQTVKEIDERNMKIRGYDKKAQISQKK